MAESLYINLVGFDKLNAKLQNMDKTLAAAVDGVLNANALEIATKAKQLAPVNLGGLRASINPDNSQPLKKHITVNANYAAYVEFGTGQYAAQFISSWPASWQAYAAQFRGKTGGKFADFLKRIEDWVRKKGIHGVTAAGSSKRGKKADADIKRIAYAIVLRILRNGIHPQPFLFPAYEQQRGQIVKDVETVLQAL